VRREDCRQKEAGSLGMELDLAESPLAVVDMEEQRRVGLDLAKLTEATHSLESRTVKPMH
jgi:hypothetical protein